MQHAVDFPGIELPNTIHRSYRKRAIVAANTLRHHDTRSIGSTYCCRRPNNLCLYVYCRRPCTGCPGRPDAFVGGASYDKIPILQSKRQRQVHTIKQRKHRQYCSLLEHSLYLIVWLCPMSTCLLVASTIYHKAFEFLPFLVAPVWPTIFYLAKVSPLVLLFHILRRRQKQKTGKIIILTGKFSYDL